MVTVMAELALGCNQGTRPKEKVEILAAVGQDQAQNFVRQVEELARAGSRSGSRSGWY